MAINRTRWLRYFLTGLIFWIAAFILSLKAGSADLSDTDVLLQLRLPRALMASAVGMGLAVAGAILQVLFTNPLCEPYTLGISSGSSLGAIVGAWLGVPLVVYGLTGSAFLGALAFAAILYLISLRARTSKSSLLLAGVMLGFLGSSLVAVAMALSDPSGLQGALFWLLGDLSRSRLSGSIASFVVMIALAVGTTLRWRSLDALLLGEENALALGVDVPKVRRDLLLISSLLVGICVSGGGMIGFVGLVIPHFSRRMAGSLHLKLIPLCAVWAAFALTAADAISRIVAKPYELPVGVVTALIGAPIFLWILISQKEAV